MNYSIIKINKIRWISSILSVLFLLTIVGCNDNGNVAKRTYQLVWSDEFNSMTSDSLPNPTYWNFDTGGGGWGNNELETYQKSTSNVKLDSVDGVKCLKIISRRSGSSGAWSYTSGRINTKGLVQYQYGRFEARIKLPYGPGIWPAFWMLGSDISSNPWPKCGEIDIMEMKGSQPTSIYGSIHGPGYSGSGSITQTFQLPSGRFDTDYHIFAIEWGIDYIDYYVDNYLYQEVTPSSVLGKGNWVFNNQQFFILLNVAVGGNFDVQFPPDSTPFPQTMYVDYIRVYKEVK